MTNEEMSFGSFNGGNSTKDKKKPKKTQKKAGKAQTAKQKKPTKITTEIEFQSSLPSKNKPPFAVLNVHKSIICAIIHCSCGIGTVKLQGPMGNIFVCDRCKTAYALETHIGLTKLNKAQKEFLENKKGLKF